MSAALLLLSGLVPLPAAAAEGDVGYRGHHFSDIGTQVTGAKPESKLWWADGAWWAIMWNESAADPAYQIYRLDRATQKWSTTGTAVDDRGGSRADALWDGSRLYVASHVYANNGTAGDPALLYRYSYDAAADRYSLDAGFPVPINSAKSETLVIDKDSTGRLWATWVQDAQVYVNATTTSDAAWGTPFVLPVEGATNLYHDDISSLVAFGGNRIGVMWSHQNHSAMYFAEHVDGASTGTWEMTRTAIQGQYYADDHINLKSLQPGADGRIYAAVKTSNTESSSPLVMLLVLNPATNEWDPYVYGLVRDHHTRPFLMLDESSRTLYMFATAGEAGGTIYVKSTSMDRISFPEGIGTPFIRDAASPDINDGTTTKQPINATTGLLVLASDDSTDYYWHNYIHLGPPPLAAAFEADPSTGSLPLEVRFTDISTGSPVAWQWDFGDGTTSAERHPTHTYAEAGSYTVRLTVTDAGGQTDTRTESGFVTVEPPPPLTADFSADPRTGAAPLGVAFTDRSVGGAVDWQWDFGDGSTSTDRHPTHTYAAAGSYTVSLTVTDETGATNTKTEPGYVTVEPPPPLAASFSADPRDGLAPLSVTFTDTSTGGPVAWQWDFGDGSTSTQQSPVHRYEDAGTYDVSLTVTDASGATNTRTEAGYVTATNSLVVAASADAYVRSGAATSNFGAKPGLRVKESSTDAYRSYLGFSVSGLSRHVLGARLRLYGNDAGVDGGSLYAITEAWGERTITWSNAPALSGAALGRAGAVTAGSWVDIPLPAEMFAAGNGSYSFALAASSINSSLVGYSSREGTQPPQLVLDLADPDYVPPPIAAGFSAEPVTGTAPLAVSFTDTSTNGPPVAWLWDFGDGATSTERHPTHTYPAAGSYTVTLTVTDAGGVTSTKTEPGYVTVEPPPPLTADFTADPVTGTAPLAVSFTDRSVGGAVAWLWDFGDGATSTERHPGHTYEVAGSYTVSLTVTDEAGATSTKTEADYITGTNTLVVSAAADSYVRSAAPSANHGTKPGLRVKESATDAYRSYMAFSVSGASRPVIGARLRLYVNDAGTDGGGVHAVTAAWDERAITWENAPPPAGSALAQVGTATVGAWMEIPLPPETFAGGDGSYSFALIASSATSSLVGYSSREGGSAPQLVLDLADPDYVPPPPPPPVADFTADPVSGTAPLTVAFTDRSSSGAIAWLWDFGDGTTSPEQHPGHTYTAPGTYAVSLTVTDAAGATGTKTEPGYVTVNAPPPLVADFVGDPRSGTVPLTVAFTDRSTGGAAAWLWDFGDGTTSTEQNPSHTYTAVGSYTVSLTVTDAAGGTNTKTEAGYISATGTLVVTPAADTYVRSGTPTTNYGTKTGLRVKEAASDTYRSYLSFSISGLSRPVASARLRLWVTHSGSDGGSVYGVTSGWDERTMTWSNAPVHSGSVLGRAGAVTAGTWVEITLPPETFAGDGTYSFALVGSTPTSSLVGYSSREGTAPAQLVLDLGGS